MSTSEFFNIQPVDTALERLFSQWDVQPQTETLDPRQALGRVLAVPVTAPINLPEFRRSTMDGFAVRAADTFGASQSLPTLLTVVGQVVMGTRADLKIDLGQAAAIHTGGMLPPGADAVVMIEKTQAFDSQQIEVLAPVAPGENVLDIGEDVQQGAPILPSGHRLRPQDIGGLLAVGVLNVNVSARPRVGILSCGDEIIPPDATPVPGQVRDINAYTLAALVEQVGGQPNLLGIAPDTLADYAALAQVGMASSDMLVLTAGSSVSTRDLTREVVNRLGSPGVLQHGLAVKPGKPTLLALCDGKPVIGLPGNPVSALLVARQIVLPIIRRMLGAESPIASGVQATLTANIPSTTGRLDTVPVRLMMEGDALLAEPVFGKSNLIFTLINADGLVQVPLNSNGLAAGTVVVVEHWL
jgi:molybdopterin molybdotransferase